MPAAGGLNKAELYIESPQKHKPLLRQDFASPLLLSVDPLIKTVSYTLLWKKPPLSAGVFIWSNVCIVCWLLGSSLLLTSSLTLLLIYSNFLMLEYHLGNTRLFPQLLRAVTNIPNAEYMTLPGSSQLSSILAHTANSLQSVYYNLQHSSQTSQTNFWFSICTVVGMFTIACAYFASSTTLIFLYWCLFSLPAVKHHQLHKHCTQEQVVNVANMSLYMVYNSYLAVCQAVNTGEDTNRDTIGGPFDTSLNQDIDRELSEPAHSMRNSTMSYIRGLPSVMTLNWRGNWRAGLATLYSRGTTPHTESTESDSDYGIEDIDEDGGAKPLPLDTRDTQDTLDTLDRRDTQGTLDTLDSNLELDFPTIGRDDHTMGTMSLGLDPDLLFDEDQSEYSVGTLGTEFTLDRGMTYNPELDVLEDESEDELDLSRVDSAGLEPSPGTIHSAHDKGDTLDGQQYMLNVLPTPPQLPKPQQINRRRSERLRSSEQLVDSQESVQDSDFYLISETDIRDADEEVERSTSGTSLASNAGSIAGSITSSVGSAGTAAVQVVGQAVHRIRQLSPDDKEFMDVE